jgi:hypothetical protein
MRHDRPEPGRPTPIAAVNAALLTRDLLGIYGDRARGRQSLDTIDEPEIRAVVVADMLALLEEARIRRGHAEIADLTRAGYNIMLATGLGVEASNLMAQRLAARGIHEAYEPVYEMELA